MREICGECKWHQYEPIDRGYVCVMAIIRVSTYNLIVGLLDKAQPKPMKKYEFEDGSFNSKCPICDERILPKVYNYCPKCGQKIDTANYEL